MIAFPLQMLKNRAGNDMYVHRGMQTYNNAPKHKELQTNAVGTKVTEIVFNMHILCETENLRCF